jgi:hypothetical protein
MHAHTSLRLAAVLALAAISHGPGLHAQRDTTDSICYLGTATS